MVALAALTLAVVALVAACSPADPPSPSSAATSSVAPVAPPESASSAAALSHASAKSLRRQDQPSERFEKDRAGCEAGDRARCLSLAERYAPAGPMSGCGVPRGRPFPSLKRAPSDVEGDRRGYLQAMSRACRAGDANSCDLLTAAPRFANMASRHAWWAGALGDPERVGARVFRASGQEKWAKILADERAGCLEPERPFSCQAPLLTLFTKEKPGADKALPANVRERAEKACSATHDCADVYMALDKSGYSVDALAPVREAFAKTLTEACLQGECTCATAASYLPDGDARRLDLGILGCEGGEADGCYLLARAYETGVGVDKDEAKGRALLDVACPPLRPIGIADAPLTEYSPRACDRLAEIAIGGAYPGTDRNTAKHYALSACRQPSYEIDHGPCVRLGMLWATRQAAGRNAHEARMVAMGESIAGGDRPHLDDCQRPSVARECGELREALKRSK